MTFKDTILFVEYIRAYLNGINNLMIIAELLVSQFSKGI